MTTLTYAGFLSQQDHRDANNILFLSSVKNPLAERLQDDIEGKQVSVRYWTADRQVTKEEVQTEFIEQLVGKADCDFRMHYSDYTGYLWTDEECNVGGHDLIRELRGYLGQWLILEIDVH
jgi:hypothetical protein